jgi:hypothetical protein
MLLNELKKWVFLNPFKGQSLEGIIKIAVGLKDIGLEILENFIG